MTMGHRIIWLLLASIVTSVEWGFTQSAWTPCPTGTPSRIEGLFCIDPNTVFICGANGTVARTATGGDSWSVSVIDSSCFFNDLWFTDPETGYLCGRDTQTGKAVLYKTTNAGTSWQLLSTGDANTSYVSLCFTGLSTGYLGMSIGTNGNILKTTNAGQTWVPYTGTAYIRSIHFSSPTTGLATGQGGVIYKTTNAGATWVSKFQLPDAPLYDFYAVFNADSVTAFAAGDRGYLYKSTNGGETWTPTFDNQVFKRRLTSGYFLNSVTGFVVGDSGTILRTTNGGTSWQLLPSNTREYLAQMCFVNQTIGYICGFNGLVLKTTTGGTVDVDRRLDQSPTGYRLAQNYPNPFNPTTVVRYQLPVAGDVKLVVFDLLGREVARLVYEKKDAGAYEVIFEGSTLPSGVYFCRMRAGEFQKTRTLLLVR
jgi:photosystem II stability/assembly factor-like uncharacterized protein